MQGASGFIRTFGETERFETHFWVEVASSRLTAKNALSTAPVRFLPAELDRVKQACDGSRPGASRDP